MYLHIANQSIIEVDEENFIEQKAAGNPVEDMTVKNLRAEIKKYLAAWQNDPINKRPIDRDSIISKLKQMALQDEFNLTSARILALVKSFE